MSLGPANERPRLELECSRSGMLRARFDGQKTLWSFEAKCERMKFGTESCEPGFYFLDIPLAWTRLVVGAACEYSDDYSAYSDEWLLSYFFSHHGVRESRFQVLERAGRTVTVRWIGVCDPHIDDQFGQGVPFALVCRADFRGIEVASEDDLERLRQIMTIDPSGVERSDDAIYVN